MDVTVDYHAVGGNCHPAAADWDSTINLLAFGAGKNLAFWQPTSNRVKGIYGLSRGHQDAITAVRFMSYAGELPILLTGSADKSLGLWRYSGSQDGRSPRYGEAQIKESCHGGSINCLATVSHSNGLFGSGATDGSVKLWNIISNDGRLQLSLYQTLSPKTPLIPLTLALHQPDADTLILAVGGTKPTFQIYAAATGESFEHQATVAGHEGWIRALAFTREHNNVPGDSILASVSQDKYIRLWRIHKGLGLAAAAPLKVTADQMQSGTSMSNKMQPIRCGDSVYTITFEALLVGHEDWVFSARWFLSNNKLRLLSASADNSLAIWEADPTDSIWYPSHRVGEISAQKGSTSATGSMGGLWNGLWGPDGASIVGLGSTGSWRKWNFSNDTATWKQSFGVSGHTKAVRGLTWAHNGAYLLSTSADQTTRLHCAWIHNAVYSWHEFARPQIHGYDLNCIGTLGDSAFVSGGDEKLLRVFQEPDDIAQLLNRLCLVGQPALKQILSANVPVLGLSNKAADLNVEADTPIDNQVLNAQIRASMLDIDHPPFEDHLAKSTLWPETEKLYGHGYEINTLAISNDSSLIATACRASSVDHAVIRIFSTQDWHLVKPPLKAHSLTVTEIAFNHDDKLLLSVGRDRQWVVWKRNETSPSLYHMDVSNSKAHSRMILTAAWSSCGTSRVFVTGSRDKSIKIWREQVKGFKCQATIDASAPVLTIAFVPHIVAQSAIFAAGTEGGNIKLHYLDVDSLQPRFEVCLDTSLSPSLPVSQLCWRPQHTRTDLSDLNELTMQLAIASDDHSVRIATINIGRLLQRQVLVTT